MATTRRRPVLGGVSGFLFGLFLGLDLWLFGVVDSDSAVITILPAVFLVVGLVLGLVRPIRLGRRRVAESRPTAEAVASEEPSAPSAAPAASAASAAPASSSAGAGGGVSGWRPIDDDGGDGTDDGGDGSGGEGGDGV